VGLGSVLPGHRHSQYKCHEYDTNSTVATILIRLFYQAKTQGMEISESNN